MGDDERTVTTTIRVPERIWLALRNLAAASDLPGRRASVSGVVRVLVENELVRQGGAEREPERLNG